MAKVPGRSRNVTGFAATRKSAEEFEALIKKAETGDLATKYEALKKQIDFRHFSVEEAKKRTEALKGLSAEQQKALAASITSIEIGDIMNGVTRDKKTHIAAGKKFADMWAKGNAPTNPRVQTWIYFYYFTISYAESKKDTALFEKALNVIKKGDTGRYKRLIASLEKKLAAMKSGGGN